MPIGNFASAPSVTSTMLFFKTLARTVRPAGTGQSSARASARLKLGCGGEAIAWSSEMNSIAADRADDADGRRQCDDQGELCLGAAISLSGVDDARVLDV